jgi:hypothetical protein
MACPNDCFGGSRRKAVPSRGNRHIDRTAKGNGMRKGEPKVERESSPGPFSSTVGSGYAAARCCAGQWIKRSHKDEGA